MSARILKRKISTEKKAEVEVVQPEADEEAAKLKKEGDELLDAIDELLEDVLQGGQAQDFVASFVNKGGQ